MRVIAACFAAVLLMGCGSSRACQGCTAPGTPKAGFDILVTEKDRAVSVRTGQKIELFLRAKAGMSNWNNLTVDDPAVLRGIPTGITAAVGVTIAGFEAVKPGTAKITATAVPLCSPGQACPQFAMLFEVTVTVS